MMTGDSSADVMKQPRYLAAALKAPGSPTASLIVL